MKEYFKKEVIPSKFYVFCKNNNADYFESNMGFWIRPVIQGEAALAIRLDNEGIFDFGFMHKSNDEDEGEYFDSDCSNVSVNDIPWIIETLNIIREFTP
jgi:hypothetical protein